MGSAANGEEEGAGGELIPTVREQRGGTSFDQADMEGRRGSHGGLIFVLCERHGNTSKVEQKK